MAALPYMQFYIADYLADTMHLSTEEHGAYLLLMFNYWQTGKPIPKNRLARIARLSNDRWISVEESLKEFFFDNGTEWIHERIESDLESVRTSLQQKSAAGKASAQVRKTKKQTGEQRKGNVCSTVVNSPLEQVGNGNETNKDPDTDLKQNPSLNARARGESDSSEQQPQSQPPPAQPEYIDGLDEPIGKFPMSNDWRPSLDFRQRAAQWGINLVSPEYLTTELAEFTAYWCSEGKAFTQIQWEQKLARHITKVRASAKPTTGGNNHARPGTGSTASQAVQNVLAARERRERENGARRYGMAAMGGDGGDIFEPLDSEERGGAIAPLDSPDWRDD